MRSLIIIEVEHGESIDPLEQYIADALSESSWTDEVKVIDYIVRVDMPRGLVLESDLPSREDIYRAASATLPKE